MKDIELRLARKHIGKALNCPCPKLVPRSGVAGAKIKCFTIYIDKEKEPYLLVESMSGDTLGCRKWTGQSFETPIDISLTSIESMDVSVTHFYGYSEVEYRGVLDFAIGRILFLPYIKIHFIRAIEAIDQYFFNKKKLFTRQRIDLLKFLIRRRLDGESVFSPFELMTGLHTIRWIYHPDKDSQLKRLNFYLDSLVDTGELRRADHRYELTGKALEAIEVYEEQERKHTENVKVQRRMFWLTLAIVLLTAAQAGLYKLPTLLDLSGWTWG